MARTPTTTPVPATPSREDEVLIREIDEAVREDALYSFMRDHGIKVLGVILLGLAGLGGYLIWDYYSEKALEEQSETLISALDYMDKRDFKTASEKVAPLLADGSAPGARAAARFLQAAAALEEGNNDKATGLFKEIAADAEAPPALRDLARHDGKHEDDQKAYDRICQAEMPVRIWRLSNLLRSISRAGPPPVSRTSS